MSNDTHDNKPRKQHYVFAHLALRALIEASPMHVLLTLLSEENGAKLLQEVWDEVGKQCSNEESAESKGLTYQLHELSDKRPVILVEMPTPEGVRECYYTATVITPPKRRWFLFERPAKTRYFTLEIGDADRGDFDTVLGEWCGESHLNYSDAPPIEKKGFLLAVVQVLKGKTKSLGASDHPACID